MKISFSYSRISRACQFLLRPNFVKKEENWKKILPSNTHIQAVCLFVCLCVFDLICRQTAVEKNKKKKNLLLLLISIYTTKKKKHHRIQNIQVSQVSRNSQLKQIDDGEKLKLEFWEKNHRLCILECFA